MFMSVLDLPREILGYLSIPVKHKFLGRADSKTGIAGRGRNAISDAAQRHRPQPALSPMPRECLIPA